MHFTVNLYNLSLCVFSFFAPTDAPAPTWEQLSKGLEAVRTVVHGLVDYIQNHSKKGGDQQQVSIHIPSSTETQKEPWARISPVFSQPPQHSKYKTYMCRDMKQKGGCPRGASCTFAHSQDELEK